jgi:Beta-carotene isomerase D27-like, C-terminal
MPPKVVPSIVKEVYNDNIIDRLFIWILSRKMAQAIGSSTKIKGYDGFVDLSKQIMQGRKAQEQQVIVVQVLQSLVPAPALWGIRTFFAPTRLVCVLNAWFAAHLFQWLVGPCEIAEAEINLADGTVRSQPSAVDIKKCRYLEDSGCVGMCVNLCKVPTQQFFTEKFGIPLTMTPNFVDLSCKMIFGQAPLTSESDPDHSQPCLAHRCPTASPTAICPNLS